MRRSRQVQERWRKQRLDGKSVETMFQNRLIEEARCSPIVARAILGMVHETLVGTDETGEEAARVGQLIFLAVAAEEPAGKPLTQCQKVTVRLTLDAGADDQEVRWRQGLEGVRRARVLRLCVEAREQGGLLSYEDLAIGLLNGGVRTVVRDVAEVEDRRSQPRSAAGYWAWPDASRAGGEAVLGGARTARDCHSAVSLAQGDRELFDDLWPGGVPDWAWLRRRRDRLRGATFECVGGRTSAFGKSRNQWRGATPPGGNRASCESGPVRQTACFSRKKGGDAMTAGTSANAKIFSSSARKTFHYALTHLLKREFPGLFGPAVTELFATQVEQLFQKFHPLRDRVGWGQIVWLAVAVDDLPSYGKRIEDTQFVPVILDLVARDDIDILLDGREWNELREARITRLCEQAHAQGG